MNLPYSKNLKDLQKICEEWTHRLHLKTIVLGYFRNVLDQAIKTIIAALLSCLLTWLLFYLVKTFWFVYSSTPVGAQFVSSFPKKAEFLSCLSEFSSFSLLMNVTKETVKICLMTAAGCQIFHLARCFYFSRGIFGKALWGCVVAGIAAYRLWSDAFVELFAVAYAAVLLISIISLPYCFSMAETAIPEIGDIFKVIRNTFEQLKISLSKIFERLE